jgi:hypothetical protein
VSGAVIYEVNLDLDAAIAGDYRHWLEAHVRELLALPGFEAARILEVCEPLPAAGRVGLCVQYTLRDRAALEAYFRDHAPRLRAQGLARFADRFSASRRVLVPAADPLRRPAPA